MWVIILSPGWAKSRTPSHYPLQKLSTSLLIAVLRMQKLLLDYGICQEHLTIYCDNTSAVNISKNSVQHSQTKHIKIRHYFIQELVEDGTLTLEFIHTNDQKVVCSLNLLIANGLNAFCQNINVISMYWSLFLLLLPHAFASSFMHCFV